MATTATVRPNRYPDTCAVCGTDIPALAGQVRRARAGGWEVTHRPPRWVGSPVSGGWVGGCPDLAAESTPGGAA